jgi:type II secretory pathway component PulL
VTTRHAIFLQSAGFRIAAVDERGVRWTSAAFRKGEVPAETDEGSARASPSHDIAAALRAAGYRGDPVLLALPSMMCLPATISLAGISSRDRQAMLYRLEEQLPLAAEDFVADLVPGESSAFGVAVPLQSVRSLVDGLESQGVSISSITPAALLAIDEKSNGTRFVRDDGMTSELRVAHGRLARWSLVQDSLSEASEIDDTAARRAASILAGAQRPMIELRRDALAQPDQLSNIRGALNAFLAAAAILMLLIAGAALVRAHRYNRAAEKTDAALVSEFQTVFPGWDSSNVPAVVESEHRKLTATIASKLPTEARGSALGSLHDVIAAFPRTSTLSIDRMTFDDASFELSGSAASLQDIEALSRATRVNGMNVSPPQSHRDDDGKWTFTIHGEKLPATTSLPVATGYHVPMGGDLASPLSRDAEGP